jgi:hypothetical protein
MGRLEQIVRGIKKAGSGHFQLTLIDQGPDTGKWAAAVVFGRDPETISYAMGYSSSEVIRQILDETGWSEL